MSEINSTSASGSQNWSPGTSAASPSDGNNGNDHGIVSRVRERAAAELSTQKNLAFDGIGSVAQAVRQSTHHLREQQHDTLAGYVEQAADQIERFAQQLRGKDLDELFDDAQRMARRQPAVFIGSAFALGLIGARFFKSSPQARRYQNSASTNQRPRSGDGTGKSNVSASPSVNRSAEPTMSSASTSASGRETGWGDGTVSPNRTTTETTGESRGMGPSVASSSTSVGSASSSSGRSRPADSSIERAK